MQRKLDPERGDWSRWVCDSHWNGLVALHGTSGAGVGVGVGLGVFQVWCEWSIECDFQAFGGGGHLKMCQKWGWDSRTGGWGDPTDMIKLLYVIYMICGSGWPWVLGL